MTTATCTKCGGPLPEQVGRGRRRKVCLKCRPSRAKSAAKPVDSVAAPGPTSGLYASTLRKLQEAKAEESPTAVAALILASRIDTGSDTGSGLAALVKQWQVTCADALDEMPVPADPVDELRARRDAKLAI